ncbi:Thylakoid soluble phosphoprotein TSP [Trema orientale]|uniref:Thylakoid soluble phosphoprotein TSP n=1 Tax=Trema orientale TaxID=63057 RepID=A0A2P5AWT1_TREOI|nr:Thylakoid soluble phosphoprotein TSP [Trema orientale]
MASLTMAFSPAAGRVFAATAAKSAGGGKEEKGFLDWILGGLQKEDQLLETDPILKKVDDKNGNGVGGGGGGGATTRGRKNSVAVPQKKKGGFGGLFAKNE